MRFGIPSFILFFLILGCDYSSQAQKSVVGLLFATDGKAAQEELRSAAATLRPALVFSQDSIRMNLELNRIRQALVERGYLEARLDYLNRKDTVSELWWYVGSRYTWTHLRLGREASALPVNTGLKPSSVFSPGAYDRLCRRLLAWGADNGYPFALVRLDSIVVLNGVLQAQLVFDRGPLVTFDSLLIRGEPKVRKRYLENQIEIHAGEPYSDRLVGRIGSRLKEVPFISEARPAEVEFSGNKARPVLFLKDKKASQFNGVIGVQPDNAGTGKVYVTGDLRLRLQNAFGRAELVELNWGNPQPRSQDLKVKVAVPFVVDLPVGVEGAFDLYKKDTTFLELNQSFGVRYILGPADALVLTIGRKSSRLIDTERFRNTTVLPEFADVNVNQVGLGFQLTRLDYRLNPRKGVSLELEGQSGIRNITRNPAIPETVYDSISLRTSQARARLAVDAYLPIRGNAVFNVGCMGSWLKSNTIFTNELYRFGGLRTLRGFDEQSLTASAFGILKSELRYIIDTNSYLLVFGNLAWYRDESKPVVFADRPYGFGAGITFETNVGIFAFTYALGSQQGNPIEFRSGKIHFGLLNTF